MADDWPPAWQKAIDAAKACGDRGDVEGAIAVLHALDTGLEIYWACSGLGIAEIPDYRDAAWKPHSYAGVPPYLDYKIHRPADIESKPCLVAWVRKWAPIAIAKYLERRGGKPVDMPAPQKPVKQPVQLDLFATEAA